MVTVVVIDQGDSEELLKSPVVMDADVVLRPDDVDGLGLEIFKTRHGHLKDRQEVRMFLRDVASLLDEP
jgi:hypothetical protein